MYSVYYNPCSYKVQTRTGFSTSTPAINAKEYQDKYEITANLNNLDPNQIKIEVQNDLMTISYKKNQEDQGEYSWLRKEYSEGDFTRSMILPKDADINQIQAKVSGNILTITIAKTPETPAKEISIQID